ncbi:MAG: DUF1902 domain-containing protein [Pseudomonadota bacterium]
MLGFHQGKTLVLTIRATWDAEASVWCATSDDVPGLVTEAATIEALTQKLEVIVPELIELNGEPDIEPEVPLELLVQSEHRLPISH